MQTHSHYAILLSKVLAQSISQIILIILTTISIFLIVFTYWPRCTSKQKEINRFTVNQWQKKKKEKKKFTP